MRPFVHTLLLLTGLLTALPASAEQHWAQPTVVTPPTTNVAATSVVQDAMGAALGASALHYMARTNLAWKVTREDHRERLEAVRQEYARLERRFEVMELLFAQAFRYAHPRRAVGLATRLGEARLHAHVMFELQPGDVCRTSGVWFMNTDLYSAFEERAVDAFRWVVQMSQGTMYWTQDSETAWNHLAALRPKEFRRLAELRPSAVLGQGLRRAPFLTSP